MRKFIGPPSRPPALSDGQVYPIKLFEADDADHAATLERWDKRYRELKEKHAPALERVMEAAKKCQAAGGFRSGYLEDLTPEELEARARFETLQRETADAALKDYNRAAAERNDELRREHERHAARIVALQRVAYIAAYPEQEWRRHYDAGHAVINWQRRLELEARIEKERRREHFFGITD